MRIGVVTSGVCHSTGFRFHGFDACLSGLVCLARGVALFTEVCWPSAWRVLDCRCPPLAFPRIFVDPWKDTIIFGGILHKHVSISLSCSLVLSRSFSLSLSFSLCLCQSAHTRHLCLPVHAVSTSFAKYPQRPATWFCDHLHGWSVYKTELHLSVCQLVCTLCRLTAMFCLGDD